MSAITYSRSAVLYARCSTDEQADSRLGLEAQRSAIETYCTREGLEIRSKHADEGISGSKGIAKSGSLDLEARPGLMEAISELQKGDVLLVAKRDRLGRDVVLSALLERLVARKGARIISASGEGTSDDDPSSMLMRRIVDAFGEYERLLIGARTKAALKAKRDRGESCGNVPYGFRALPKPDGTKKLWELVPDEEERKIIATAQDLRASGRTYRAVVSEMEDMGIVNRAGQPHRLAEVYSMCQPTL